MPAVLHILPHRGGGGETYVDLLEGLPGYSHHRVHLASARTAAAAAPSLAAGWARAAARARRADLVHVHGDMAVLLALPIAARHPAAVWTTHGLHLARRVTGVPRRAARRGLRAAISATARTVCTSEAEREELLPLAAPGAAGRIVTVRNGIALPPQPGAEERRAARTALGIEDDGEVVALFLGELEPRKAPLVAVQAAERARAAGARLTLLVAGDGPQAAEVAAHTGPAVRPLGFRSDVPALLAASDVLVMPSEREGLSFAVLEAMGRGLAPVVSDGAGNPEAVGPDGLVLPAGDVGAFADALARLASDRAERDRLGAAARSRVATELSLERLLAGVGDAYAAALAPR